MSRKSEENGLPVRYQAKRLDKGGLLSHHHTRRLDSLQAIGSEMGRVYRATINGLISTADGARLTFMLRERRCTQEAINAEAALAIANAPPPPPAKINVSIVTVPHGTFVSKEQFQQMENGEFLQTIEHERVPLENYARDAAAQVTVDREIDAAVEAAAAVIPHDVPMPNKAIVPPAPPLDQDEIDRANGFEFSRPYDQRRRPQPMPPKKTQSPLSRAELEAMTVEELARRAGVSLVD